jgi:hypothetical protein
MKNTTALVLLDQHNTNHRQLPIDRQMGGSAAITR